MDKLDFLDGPSAAETPAPVQEAVSEAPVETAQAAPQPASDGPQRGPDGKFVSATAPVTSEASATPAITPDAATAAPEPTKAPEGYVPVEALTTLRREFQAFKQQVQAPPQPAPDPYEDFEAYQMHQEDQRQGERFNWSYRILEIQQGGDVAQKVKEWAGMKADQDPIFMQRAMSTSDPFSFAFEEYQQAEALKVLTDPALRQQFQAFLSGAAPSPQAAYRAASPNQPTAPPPSINQAPSAGGAQSVPVGPGQAYDAIFG